MEHQTPSKKLGIDYNPSYCYGEASPLNLSALNGLRCLTSFSIITFHVQMIHGIAYFLSFSPCYANVFQSFFGFWHVRPSHQMAIFWMISGFLCEYQLHKMHTNALLKNNKKQKQIENNYTNQMNGGSTTTGISTRQYLIFLCNRVLRLYPLYFILAVFSYITLTSDQRDLMQYNVYDLVKTLFFVKQWDYFNSNVFAGVSWSVEVDLHGYIAIMILFALTSSFTYNVNDNTMEKRRDRAYLKRMIIVGWYAVSMIHMFSYRPLPWQSLSYEGVRTIIRYGGLGTDRSKGVKVALRNIYLGDRKELYPNFDFNSPMNESLISFNAVSASNTYFGGIFNHGVAILLGSLLYLNLYVRNGEQSNPTRKLLYFFFGLLLTQGWYVTAAIPVYFLMDAILTMKPDSKQNMNGKDKNGSMSIGSNIQPFNQKIQSFILTFLSNPLFTMLSEYTYGIYMFHMPFILLLEYKDYAVKLAVIKSALSDGVDEVIASCVALENAGYRYDIIFVTRVALISCTAALIVSYTINVFVERPINRLRKQFLPKFA